MSRTLIASITELCVLDHRNDPAAIAAWTANKTEGGVAAMLNATGSRMFVAERDGEVAGVGCIIGSDVIGLNYVHPAHRFQGVSRALLAAMEAALREHGTSLGHLDSTATAHAFYAANGWQDTSGSATGPADGARPMHKLL